MRPELVEHEDREQMADVGKHDANQRLCIGKAGDAQGLQGSDDEGNAIGQGGAKGPFLLEQVAPLSGPDKVDGIPGGQPRDQAWPGCSIRGEKAG